MNKKTRQTVYQKYDGHCAYCGKRIEYEDMQVDHCIPKRGREFELDYNGTRDKIHNIKNLMPSCRQCNHYKRAYPLKAFRELIKTLHERIEKIYISKVAIDYGIVTIHPHDGVFYFERQDML